MIFKQTCSPTSVQYIFCILYFYDKKLRQKFEKHFDFLIVTVVSMDNSVIDRRQRTQRF